jgi:hypothetical protein
VRFADGVEDDWPTEDFRRPAAGHTAKGGRKAAKQAAREQEEWIAARAKEARPGLGRIVVSEIEAPNLLVKLV